MSRARRDSAVSRAIDFCRRVGAEPLEWPGRGRRASGVILRGRAQALGVGVGSHRPSECPARLCRLVAVVLAVSTLINSHKTAPW